MSTARRLSAIWWAEHEPHEFIVSLMALSWGVLLLLPWDTFSTGPAYKAMREVASESAWGQVFFALGIFQFIALFSNNRSLRRASALFSFTVWTFTSAMFGFANYTQTTIVTYPFIALGSAWAYLRLRRV